MKKTFSIFGEICDTDVDCFSYEDTTPNQVSSFLKKLDEGDEVEFVISSPGGSCSAGLAISNLIKTCGHKTTARVVGLAASMASVIACSCDELLVDQNAMIMVHLPWTVTMGNSNDLRKEADVLDQYKEALISVYKTKFDIPEDQIEKMLVDETWISGEHADTVGLKCTVVPNDEPIRVAACSKIPKYLHQPENIKDYIKVVEKKDGSNTKDETAVPLSEVEKRVSGMQSAMAKQMDSLKKEYDAKINDLTVKLQAKEEELNQEKNRFISLNQDLDRCKEELKETSSALAEKTNALETLNANVNYIPEELPSFKDGLSKCKTPKEKVEFITSGKYVK